MSLKLVADIFDYAVRAAKVYDVRITLGNEFIILEDDTDLVRVRVRNRGQEEGNEDEPGTATSSG